jgi:hypothetical protein
MILTPIGTWMVFFCANLRGVERVMHPRKTFRPTTHFTVFDKLDSSKRRLNQKSCPVKDLTYLMHPALISTVSIERWVFELSERRLRKRSKESFHDTWRNRKTQHLHPCNILYHPVEFMKDGLRKVTNCKLTFQNCLPIYVSFLPYPRLLTLLL